MTLPEPLVQQLCKTQVTYDSSTHVVSYLSPPCIIHTLALRPEQPCAVCICKPTYLSRRSRIDHVISTFSVYNFNSASMLLHASPTVPGITTNKRVACTRQGSHVFENRVSRATSKCTRHVGQTNIRETPSLAPAKTGTRCKVYSPTHIPPYHTC
jgi:hypothetical protein